MFGKKLHASGGSEVEVIDPGCLNTDAGPDFFNSKIRIDGVMWAGNVEIHVRASDWNRHGHSDNPAYDDVMLHVVGISDCRIKRRDGTYIPQVEITMPEDFFRSYANLSAECEGVKCATSLGGISRLDHIIYGK